MILAKCLQLKSFTEKEESGGKGRGKLKNTGKKCDSSVTCRIYKLLSLKSGTNR